jgi:thiamine pyrophosphokinase
MIVAVCSGKGRFDHNMGNINTLFKANFICDIPVILMSERDLQYVIPSGCRHELLLDTGLEGPHCGLIPVHGASTVTTSGLRWNLDRQKMEFGGLISTSNEVASVSVSVESDLPILWTMSVKEPDASTE